MTRDIINLADVRRRLEAEREDLVAPIRESFMEELGELLEDYLEELREATGGDADIELQELIATCSTVLAMAAEEHFEDAADQVEFIETVAEIAAELVDEEGQTGDLFGDDPEPR